MTSIRLLNDSPIGNHFPMCSKEHTCNLELVDSKEHVCYSDECAQKNILPSTYI